MSEYLKMIRELMSNGGKIQYSKPAEEQGPNLDFPTDVGLELPPELEEKVKEYTKNMGVFELVLNNALKKNSVSLSQVDTKLEEKEKEQVLSTVMELISQFEEMFSEEKKSEELQEKKEQE